MPVEAWRKLALAMHCQNRVGTERTRSRATPSPPDEENERHDQSGDNQHPVLTVETQQVKTLN